MNVAAMSMSGECPNWPTPWSRPPPRRPRSAARCCCPGRWRRSSYTRWRMPARVRTIVTFLLSFSFYYPGQDWEHFILGLGRKLPQSDDIRIRQGDLDRLERTFAGNRMKIMNCALVDFERNCQKYEVNINIAQHVVEVLKDKDILFPPYSR